MISSLSLANRLAFASVGAGCAGSQETSKDPKALPLKIEGGYFIGLSQKDTCQDPNYSLNTVADLWPQVAQSILGWITKVEASPSPMYSAVYKPIQDKLAKMTDLQKKVLLEKFTALLADAHKGKKLGDLVAWPMLAQWSACLEKNVVPKSINLLISYGKLEALIDEIIKPVETPVVKSNPQPVPPPIVPVVRSNPTKAKRRVEILTPPTPTPVPIIEPVKTNATPELPACPPGPAAAALQRAGKCK